MRGCGRQSKCFACFCLYTYIFVSWYHTFLFSLSSFLSSSIWSWSVLLPLVVLCLPLFLSRLLYLFSCYECSGFLAPRLLFSLLAPFACARVFLFSVLLFSCPNDAGYLMFIACRTLSVTLSVRCCGGSQEQHTGAAPLDVNV